MAYRKLLVVWNTALGFSQSRVLPEFWCSAGMRRDYPFFHKKGFEVKCDSLSLTLQPPWALKNPVSQCSPREQGAARHSMSRADKEPKSGPNQGAGNKGDRMRRPEDIHPQRDRPILTRTGCGLRCSSRGMEERERVFPSQLPSPALSDLRQGNLIIIPTLLTS